MLVLVSRVLVFCAALNLTLPPGWCCLLPQTKPTPSEDAPAEPTPSPETCCCCPPAPAQSSGDEGEPQAPMPPPPPGCCCPPAQATTTEPVSRPSDSAQGLVAGVPAAPFTAPVAGSTAVAPSAPAPLIPLQLFL